MMSRHSCFSFLAGLTALALVVGCGDDASPAETERPRTGGVCPMLQIDAIEADARAGDQVAEAQDEEKAPAPAAASQAEPAAEEAADGETPPREKGDAKPVGVTELEVDDLSSFSLGFTCQPQLETLLDYVKVTPSPGPMTVNWWEWSDTCRFSTELAPCTTYTVTVRAGLPFANGRTLARTFRRTFATGHRPAEVSFAAEGRYLPAAGRRVVAVKAVNVTNLYCTVRTVPSHNIVQLLAREEDRYGRYYGGGGDSRDTRELGEEPVEQLIPLRARRDEVATVPLAVRGADGAAVNGVYLLEARAEKPKDDEEAKDAYASRFKLVCVTDIGLSVRRAGACLYVWATSLTRGAPRAGLRVKVYGANNVAQGEGVTDDEGWCCCELPEKSEPFAVVVATPKGDDLSFMALSKPLDETPKGPARRAYVAPDGSEAFVWTERGIYRHNEPIFIHALLRNGEGNAPKPFPVTLALFDPEGREQRAVTRTTDAWGSVCDETFRVADDQPSGLWRIVVRTPGKDAVELGHRLVKIEEFVPPQIRVKVAPQEAVCGTGVVFTVSAEHLFGAPAKDLVAEGAVRFEDVPFAPRGWEGFRFGDERRRLKPNFTVLGRETLDAEGRATFAAALEAGARPRAAVKATVQGSVFENGGRPASARATATLHAYPYYIGVALPDTLRAAKRPRATRIALVAPDGTPCAGARTLTARFERIDHVYGLKRNPDGSREWRTEKIRYPFGEEQTIPVAATGLASIDVPVAASGDYALTVFDAETGVSFGASYWVGGANDTTVRAALENPATVTLVADRPRYYPGERPRLTVKAPFAGSAWLSVMRDEMVYSQVVTLTNATSELVLEPVAAEWAPGVDVSLSVVQRVRAGARSAANRAWGVVPLACATRDSAVPVRVSAAVRCAPEGGSTVDVDVEARGADAVAERAVVTLTDEGIHILTDEKVPDPVAWFGETRTALHPLYDYFNRLLPVLDEDTLRRAGAKTGGGAEGDLFRRISPIPTRRFKPLSLWQASVPLAEGRGRATFTLPEFAGEVRVTAVAYSARATGAGSVRAKVAPKVVMLPDAPRFAAPGDTFLATVTLANRSGRDGRVQYDLLVAGSAALAKPVHGTLALAAGASETLNIPVRATETPGEATLTFVSEGFGEKHVNTIDLPVRPAVPWRKTAGTLLLKPGEKRSFATPGGPCPEAGERTFTVSASPVAELASALAWLVAYPHGCLEQTVSRVFPLIAAGGLLNTLPVSRTSAAEDARPAVEAGIRRVTSMIREDDFVMWPDTTSAPWDPEVSLWAAHFLLEARKAGYDVPAECRDKVLEFQSDRASSTNAAIGVYACHNLALAGKPDRDRMFAWFDQRAHLAPLDRARLARAYACIGERSRAAKLLEHLAPSDVKEAAFALLALMDTDAQDPRLAGLAAYLLEHRDRESNRWGTTAENAHALLALATWYRPRSPADVRPDLWLSNAANQAEPLAVKRTRRYEGGGTLTVENRGASEAFLAWTCRALPKESEVKAFSHGLRVAREYLRIDGSPADLDALARGDRLVVRLRLTATEKRAFSDLVIEDLLPAGFEPDGSDVPVEAFMHDPAGYPWLLRRDFRDDRALFYSCAFSLDADESVTAYYCVRAVSAGDFIVPGLSVEAMYEPALAARSAARRMKVAR